MKNLLAVNFDDIVGSIAPAFFFPSGCFCTAEAVGCCKNIPGQEKDHPEIRNISEGYSIDWDNLPMVDQGASASILLAEFWPSEDPEKSTPWSPALHDAADQTEVAVPHLLTIFAAYSDDT